MKKNLLLFVFLLQNFCIIVSDTRNRPHWPRHDDVNEWPISLSEKKLIPAKNRKWPQKREINKKGINPFVDSQDDFVVQEIEMTEMQVGGEVALSGMPSPATSIESFFDCDWSAFRPMTFPLHDLIDEEEDDRICYEDISNAEWNILDQENRLVTNCFRERIEMYQRSVEYVAQFDALCSIIMSDKKRSFSVTHSRKGSLKMRGFHKFFEEVCADLLNGCNDRQFLWAQCVYACSIYQNSAQRVASMLDSEDQ